MSIADDNGLILAARVGKHTDELIEEIVEGKTGCQHWNTDGRGGYRTLYWQGSHLLYFDALPRNIIWLILKLMSRIY